MADKRKTTSEKLFEKFCNGENVTCVRLPELKESKQPDYELKLQGELVVVEVKQIEPNADDEKYHDTLEREGRGGPQILDSRLA